MRASRRLVLTLLLQPVLLGIYSTFVMAGGGGVGGDDDDFGTQTPRTISPQGPFYSVFSVLFLMVDHLI